MPMNTEWHNAHRMPANASERQRLEWQEEHARNCDCRGISPRLQRQITEYRARNSK